MVNLAVAVPREELAAFCRRRHIGWLAFVGSVLTDEFRPDSDIDVLVKIDLLIRQDLNRWIRNRLLAEAEVLYAEG